MELCAAAIEQGLGGILHRRRLVDGGSPIGRSCTFHRSRLFDQETHPGYLLTKIIGYQCIVLGGMGEYLLCQNPSSLKLISPCPEVLKYTLVILRLGNHNHILMILAADRSGWTSDIDVFNGVLQAGPP